MDMAREEGRHRKFPEAAKKRWDLPLKKKWAIALCALAVLWMVGSLLPHRPSGSSAPKPSPSTPDRHAGTPNRERPECRQAVALVRKTLRPGLSVDADFKAGPLKNGTAVLADDMAAYWVPGETVYAANGVALTWSPSTQRAPAGIDIDTVSGAVK